MRISQEALTQLLFLAPVTSLGSSDSTSAPAPAAAAAAQASFEAQSSPPNRKKKKNRSSVAESIHSRLIDIDIEHTTDTKDFPTSLQLAVPSSNPTLHGYFETNKKVVARLGEDGAIFLPPKGDNDVGFRLEEITMGKGRGAGVYRVILPDGPKTGRDTDMKDRKEKDTRYKPLPPENATVLCFWDKLESRPLDMIDNSLKECYTYLTRKHFNDNFGEWLKSATFDDVQQMEVDMGGITIWFIVYMYQAIELGGLEKLGVRKGLHLNHVESALQIFLGDKNGAAHEHIHYSDATEWLIQTVDLVDKDVESFCSKLEQLTCKQLNDLDFEHIKDSVSWEPGYNFNSAEVIESELEELFNGRSLDKMEGKDIKSVLEDNERFTGVLSSVDDATLDRINNVKELTALLFKYVGDFKAVTEIVYDLFFGKHNSKHDYWSDVFPKGTEGEYLFNPASLGAEAKEKARVNQLDRVKELASKADHCSNNNKVFWFRMDRNLAAFDDESELQTQITRFGFHVFHKFCNGTVFCYIGEHGSLGLLFLHHAFSKGLSSLPPYAVRRFSSDQEQDQCKASISFHWHQAVGFIFDGKSVSRKSLHTLIGSILPAFVLRKYIIDRVHHGDYRIATLFGKDLATTNQEGHKKLEDLRLKQTWINRRARVNESNSLDSRNDQDSKDMLRRFRIMNFCSWCVYNKLDFDKVIDEIIGDGRMTDNGRDHGYTRFLTNLTKVLDKEKKIWLALKNGCIEIARVRTAEKEKREKEKAEKQKKLIEEEERKNRNGPDDGSNSGNGVSFVGNLGDLFKK